MMRKVFAVILTGAVLVVGAAAQAGMSIDVIFRVSGTDITSVDPGTQTQIIADVILTSTDSSIAHGVNVSWDSSGGLAATQAASLYNSIELFSMTTNSLGVYGRLGVQKVGVTDDGITATTGNFESSANPFLPPSLAAGTWNVGTIIWDATTGAPGVYSLMTSLSNGGAVGLVVGAVNNAGAGTLMNQLDGNSPLVQLGSGSITIVPEPGTAALLGLGLMGLMVASRRRDG